jgi:hypothetical protein
MSAVDSAACPSVQSVPLKINRLVLTATVLALGAATVGVVVSVASPAGAATSVGGYVPVATTRLLDTRTGLGAPTHPVASGGIVTLQVTGAGSPIPTGAAAIALNVTAVSPTAAGYVTVWASGAAPLASNLNFTRGLTIANSVISPIASDGTIRLLNGSTGTTQLLADVNGYYTAGTASDPGTLHPLAPNRILDTRTGTGAPRKVVGAGATLSLKVTNGTTVPNNAAAAVLNVTAVAPTKATFITVWGDGARPGTSSVNVSAGHLTPNLVVTPIASDGTVHLYNSAGSVNLVADISGYFLGGATPSTEGSYTAVTPTRVLDTRHAIGGATGIVPQQGTRYLPVTGITAGTTTVPSSGVAAVVLNVTATQEYTVGYVSAYPAGTPLPATSNLNYSANADVANLAIVPVSADGTVALFNGSAGTTNLVVDISGFILGSPQPSWVGAQASRPTGVNPEDVFGTDVRCPATGACISLGNYGNATGGTGLLQVQSGSGWTSTPMPTGSGTAAFYNDLSCPVTGWCAAVGLSITTVAGPPVSVTQLPIVDVYDSGTQTATDLPVPVGYDPTLTTYTSISCTSSTACVALGQTALIGSTTDVAAAATLAAGTWTATVLNNPADASSDGVQAYAIECPTSTSCVGLGSYTDTTGNGQGVVEILASGIWTTQETPVPADAAANPETLVDGSSCWAAASCQLAGSYVTNTGIFAPFTVGVSGTTLTATRLPVPVNAVSTLDARLNDIGCTSATACVAVGSYNKTTTANGSALIETLAGSTWTATRAQTPTSPNAANSELVAIDCPLAGACTAVGDFESNSNRSEAMISTLSAGAWSATAAPLPADNDPNQQSSGLIDVACSPTNANCVGVGDYAFTSMLSAELLESWPGN